MMDSVYVTYAADGTTITGAFANPQGFITTPMSPSDPAVSAFMNPPPPQTVLSQDLMAQFTVADYSAIVAAVAGNASFGLLWVSLQTQKDPMVVTNARFLAGWAALTQVLGAPRMAAIATALSVMVT